MSGCQSSLPWLEKYRPKSLDQVVGNEEIIFRFKSIASQGNIPNLLLAGPPGIGKTTVISCLANELLGDSVKDAVLELNASDDRGIEVVRNKIKMFAMKKVHLPPSRHKVVILDEADSMTAGAQQALRRIMEIYSETTRFALACNTSSKIIEPIQSRCAIVRLGKLEDAQILKRLQEVSTLERVDYTADGLRSILFTADGDMRQAINNLQSTATAFGLVSDEHVYRICDVPNPGALEKILACCQEGKAEEAASRLARLWGEGYGALDLVGTLFRVLKYSTALQEHLQLAFMKEVGLAHVRCLQGSASLLQLCGMLSAMCSLGGK